VASAASEARWNEKVGFPAQSERAGCKKQRAQSPERRPTRKRRRSRETGWSGACEAAVCKEPVGRCRALHSGKGLKGNEISGRETRWSRHSAPFGVSARIGLRGSPGGRFGSQILERGTRERNYGNGPEAGRVRTGSLGPVTKLREKPETPTGDTKRSRRGTGERKVARPGLQAALAWAVSDVLAS